MSGRQRILQALAAFVFAMANWTAFAADLITVDDLHKLKDKWTLLLGSEFRLDVRVKLFGPRLLTLLGSDLQYRSDQPLTRAPGTDRYELVGSLQKESGSEKIFFQIRELKPLPSDLDLLHERRRRIMTTRASDWYEVARWAEERGRLYENAELLQESKELFQNGLETEYGQMNPREPSQLRALIAKVDEWKLEGELRERLVHEAFRTEFEQLLKRPNSDLTDLMTRITRDLPGAGVALTQDDQQMLAGYTLNPIEFYKTANSATRQKAHRLLYVAVYRERVLRAAQLDGRNGREIASRLEQIPELANLAVEFREKQSMSQFTRIGTMTRQEMLEFAKVLTEGKDERAEGVPRAWLKAREPRLKKEGVNGLIELGDESLALLNDSEQAIRWFKEADKLSPNLGLVADRFAKLHYVKHEGRWIPEVDVPPPTADPFYSAVQDGRIEVGMSPKHVRAALGSAPDELIRTITGAGVREWWFYRNDGLAIELSTQRNRNSLPKVTRVRSSKGAVLAPDQAPAPGRVAPGL